jgi:hypothetical protein
VLIKTGETVSGKAISSREKEEEEVVVDKRTKLLTTENESEQQKGTWKREKSAKDKKKKKEAELKMWSRNGSLININFVHSRDGNNFFRWMP